MRSLKSMYVVSLLVFANAFSMQQLKPIKREISATLAGLPTDLKKYLLPFVASGFPAFAARDLFSFATLSKEFNRIVNDEKVMRYFLDEYNRKAPYTAHVVDLGKRLAEKPKTFSVMRKPELGGYLLSMDRQLNGGLELFSTIYENNAGALKKLLSQKNIDLNCKNSYFYESSLWIAIYQGKLEVGKLLLEAGTNPNQFTTNCHNVGIWRLLLDFGANPNMKFSGTRPLIEAVKFGNKDLVKRLLATGASLDSKDCVGKTARDYARDSQHKGAQRRKIYRMLGRVHYEKKQKLLAQKQ